MQNCRGQKPTLWQFIKISHAIEIRGLPVAPVAQKWGDGPTHQLAEAGLYFYEIQVLSFYF